MIVLISSTLAMASSEYVPIFTLLSAVVVLRPIRAFFDGLRFPLRLRYDLVMQLLLLG